MPTIKAGIQSTCNRREEIQGTRPAPDVSKFRFERWISKRRSKIGIRSEDEVYVEAIAGARIVPHVDRVRIMVVTVEHGVAANVAMNSIAGSCPK